MLIGEMLQLSPLRVVTARPDNTILEAAKRMSKFGVGIVVVMGENDEILGVLSERDIVIGIAAGDGALQRSLVGDWMTASVVTISPRDTIADAARDMNVHGIRHLIAVEDGRPVGVVSIRDVLRVIAAQFAEDDPRLVKTLPAA